MLRPSRIIAFCCLLASPVAVVAQEPTVSVKTFPLHSLRPDDAAKLIAPYVQSAQGGVFDAGAIRAITVRETPPVLARIDSLLREHDRPREVLVLRFQLIAALDTAPPRADPSIATIDSVLRRLFRFGGYRLLAEGTTTAEERNEFSLTMVANERQFSLAGFVEAVETTAGRSTAGLTITLSDNGWLQGGSHPTRLFSTGLTMPLGQTLVLGSAAAASDKSPTLILAPAPGTPGNAKINRRRRMRAARQTVPTPPVRTSVPGSHGVRPAPA
jgi:hypothetical protein